MNKKSQFVKLDFEENLFISYPEYQFVVSLAAGNNQLIVSNQNGYSFKFFLNMIPKKLYKILDGLKRHYEFNRNGFGVWICNNAYWMIYNDKKEKK